MRAWHSSHEDDNDNGEDDDEGDIYEEEGEAEVEDEHLDHKFSLFVCKKDAIHWNGKHWAALHWM